jgi:hypothetical protein
MLGPVRASIRETRREVEVDLPAQAPLPASMVVRLRYVAHEADFAPSVPGDDEDCTQAGTWVEGHRVEECCAASPARGNDVPLDLTSQ